MVQDVPQEQLLAGMQAKVDRNFYEVLKESRGVDRTEEKVTLAEQNQLEIERLVRQIDQLGTTIDRKLTHL